MSRIGGKASDGRHETMETAVSKTYLAACLHPSGDRFSVSNDAMGHMELQTCFTSNGVGRAVTEASGRYQRAAQVSLHGAGIQVAILNPHHTRRFAHVRVGSTRRTRSTPKFLPRSQP